MRWWYALAAICRFFSWVDDEGEQHGLYRLIHDREDNDPYLHRYYLLNTRILERPWFKRHMPYLCRFSFRLVLHNCVRSDADGLHDHPWDWGSKILENGYIETLPGPSGETIDVRRLPGKWRWRKSTDFHRLELPDGITSSWSLFLMGPKLKDWGFQDRNGNWVQWREYLDNRNEYA